MSNKISIIIILCLSITCSCSKYNDELKSIFKKLYGTKLSLVDTQMNSKLTIVSSIDGGCSSCIDKLVMWESWIDVYYPDIDFIFYISSDSVRFNSIDSSIFKYPQLLVHDEGSTFLKANEIYSYEKQFHTFLLDSNSNVILIGNPMFNDATKGLYKSELKRLLLD